MGNPLRIAVLECDEAAPELKAKYGGYGGLFETRLNAGAKLLSHISQEDLVVSKWDVVKAREYPKIEDIDAVLLTGSRKLICYLNHGHAGGEMSEFLMSVDRS